MECVGADPVLALDGGDSAPRGEGAPFSAIDWGDRLTGDLTYSAAAFIARRTEAVLYMYIESSRQIWYFVDIAPSFVDLGR